MKQNMDALGTKFLIAGFWSLFWSVCFAFLIITIPLSFVSAGIAVNTIRRGFQIKNGDAFDTKDMIPKSARLHFGTLLTMDIVGVFLAVMMNSALDDDFVKAYLQGNATALAGIRPSSTNAVPRTTEQSSASPLDQEHSPWGDVDRYEDLLEDPSAQSEASASSSPWGDLNSADASSWSDLPAEQNTATEPAEVHVQAQKRKQR